MISGFKARTFQDPWLLLTFIQNGSGITTIIKVVGDVASGSYTVFYV